MINLCWSEHFKLTDTYKGGYIGNISLKINPPSSIPSVTVDPAEGDA